MGSPHVVSQCVLVARIWLVGIMHRTRPTGAVVAPDTTALSEPINPKRARSNEPKPFEGLTQKPHCTLWERETVHPQAPPPVPPPPYRRRIDARVQSIPHSTSVHTPVVTTEAGSV